VAVVVVELDKAHLQVEAFQLVHLIHSLAVLVVQVTLIPERTTHTMVQMPLVNHPVVVVVLTTHGRIVMTLDTVVMSVRIQPLQLIQ
jgi:hypothetical protein